MAGKNRDEYKRLTEFLEVILVIAVYSAVFITLWETVYMGMTEAPLVRRGNWAIAASYPIMWLAFGKVFGAFHISTRKIDIIFSHIGTIIVVNALSYFIIVLATRVYVPVWPLVIGALVEVVAAFIWLFIVKKINNLLFPPRRLLLIHGDFSYKDILFTVNKKSERYTITETINISENMATIQNRINDHESVIITDIPAEKRNDVLKYCYSIGKRVYMYPKLSDIIIRSAGDVHIGDSQIYLLHNFGLSADQRFIKRIGDIVVSVLVLVLAGWLMAIIALLIKLEDGGSVFYRQERLTRGGRAFRIIKFRSMVPNAEKLGPQLSTKGDSRVTKVGRILRVTHLDELPQIFNVLSGDMSVVGPRPERPSIMKEYMENVPEFEYRLKVKGGITGYAQVYGKYNTTPYNKLRLDLIYIQNYSAWLDIKCCISTLKVLFKKETSEGIEDNQTTALK